MINSLNKVLVCLITDVCWRLLCVRVRTEPGQPWQLPHARAAYPLTRQWGTHWPFLLGGWGPGTTLLTVRSVRAVHRLHRSILRIRYTGPMNEKIKIFFIFQMSCIWANGFMLMIVCVLSDLTWRPLLGGGRKSWDIIFWLSCDRLPGLIFFVPALLLSLLKPLFLPSSSVPLYFLILAAVPMRKCLGKHSCMSSPIPIALLNGTLFFRETRWS